MSSPRPVALDGSWSPLRLHGPPRAAGRAYRVFLYALPLLVLTALKQPVCIYALVLHSPCPGCGLTRATLALLSGDVATASQYNPLALGVCPIAATIAAYGIGRYVLTGRSGLENRWIAGVSITLCLALFVVWVARMFGAFGGPVPV